jgi:hypothetical protein
VSDLAQQMASTTPIVSTESLERAAFQNNAGTSQPRRLASAGVQASARVSCRHRTIRRAELREDETY